MNRRFVLSLENIIDRTVHTGYYLPKVEIRDYNFIIDGKKLIDRPVTSNFRTCYNIQKIATGQGSNYTDGCLLD